MHIKISHLQAKKVAAKIIYVVENIKRWCNLKKPNNFNDKLFYTASLVHSNSIVLRRTWLIYLLTE